MTLLEEPYGGYSVSPSLQHLVDVCCCYPADRKDWNRHGRDYLAKPFEADRGFAGGFENWTEYGKIHSK